MNTRSPVAPTWAGRDTIERYHTSLPGTPVAPQSAGLGEDAPTLFHCPSVTGTGSPGRHTPTP
jgi:hypothetical protein